MRRFIDYEPVPFYFLNDEFNREEIIRQLDFMAENGITSFFLHVRDGVNNEAWGTERFFLNMKFVIEESIKRDIKPWLYDEDSYPSGQAGGKIVIDRPELLAYGLNVKKAEYEKSSGLYKAYLGRVKGLFGYEVKRENGVEKVRVIENCFGPVRRRWYRRDMTKTYYADMADLKYDHVRACTSYTEIMFEAKADENSDVYYAYLAPSKTDGKYGAMADCLNSETTKEFITRVHEKYKAVVGKYFGKEIQGIFMDEPSVGAGLPFTGELSDFFFKRTGYELKSKLYMLSSDYKGDGAAFRRDYVSAIKSLFFKNFIQPIKAWCEKNGLKFVGHYCGEEDPLVQALSGQDVYENVAAMDIPGFDIITANIGDAKHPSLTIGANLVASAAAQCGKKRILAESFALAPFNYGYSGMKRTADWLFACGINMIVTHGFHYGYNAYQRGDAGKSFFFQDPQFEEYVKFSEYAGRSCKLLSEYERNNDILIVVPDGAFAEEVPFPIGNNGIAPSERAVRIRSLFFEAAKHLFTRHVGFDLTETDYITDKSVVGGKVVIGEKKYSHTIVVKGGSKEEATYKKLIGKTDVAFYGGGELNEFVVGDRLRGENAENVLSYEKFKGSNRLTFLFNDSASAANFELKVGENAFVYNAEKDVSMPLSVKDGVAVIKLCPFQSIITEETKEPFGKIEGVYNPEKTEKNSFEFLTNPQLYYMPQGARKAITRYDLTVTDKNGTKKYENIKYSRLRDVIGTQDEIYKTDYVIPYFDTAERPESVYPVKAEFSACIKKEDENDFLLFDRDTIEGDFKMYFNGKEIDKNELKSCRVYDVHNYCFTPEWKEENVLKIVFEKAGEFDGIGGEIYLMKNAAEKRGGDEKI